VHFLQRVTYHTVAWEEVSLIFKEKRFYDVDYSSPSEPASKTYALNRLLQWGKGQAIDLDFQTTSDQDAMLHSSHTPCSQGHRGFSPFVHYSQYRGHRANKLARTFGIGVVLKASLSDSGEPTPTYARHLP